MTKPNVMLWVDLETTDTNVNECGVLEIGAFFTDMKLNKISGDFELVVTPTGEHMDRLFREPIVVDMHSSNGLLTEIAQLNADNKINTVSTFITWLIHSLEDLKLKLPEEPVIQIAGSGVAVFDKPILERLTSLKFYYAPFDVGQARRLFSMSENTRIKEIGQVKEEIPHRALADINNHWEEAKRYIKWLNDVEDMWDSAFGALG